MNICLNCGSEYEAKRASSKYCGSKCRVAHGRVSVTEEEVSVTKNGVSVTDSELSVTNEKVSVTESLSVTDSHLTFMGVSLDELDEYFKIGNPQYCELLNTKSVFHRSELPFWLMEGKMERDGLPLAKSVFLKADEVRRRFRDMMFKFDLRFGARKGGDLIAMGEM